jgi:AbrB family looped-hinge helix DNA binding protein
LTNYVFHIKLKSMKIGERGQATIPKEIRDRFGLRPETEVEFRVVKDAIILEKKPKRLNLNRWKGHCKGSSRLGYESVNDFIEDVRGR